jgi:hypothetical protein
MEDWGERKGGRQDGSRNSSQTRTPSSARERARNWGEDTKEAKIKRNNIIKE